MKFALVFALAIVSFNSMAFEHVLSSSSKITGVGKACYDNTTGRNINFGITKMCFDYSQKTEQTVILTDPESRGAAVPGSRPYKTESVSKKSVCNYGSSANNDVEETCEASRLAFIKHLRK